jgi:methionine-S-sulfoxide reductase
MLTLVIKVALVGLGVFAAALARANGEAQHETATFAGGCSWCMQPPFEKLDRVVKVQAGYAGGAGPNPRYEDYAEKGHVEVVQITYDPDKISYPQLLEVF